MIFNYKIVCEDCVHKHYALNLKASVCSLCNCKIKRVKECPLNISVEDIKRVDDLEREENVSGIYFLR